MGPAASSKSVRGRSSPGRSRICCTRRRSDGEAIGTLSDREGSDRDPIQSIIALLVAKGVAVDKDAVFGAPPARAVAVPPYPFQRQPFNLRGTSEALLYYCAMAGAKARHPLLGYRLADGSPEWRSLLSTRPSFRGSTTIR